MAPPPEADALGDGELDPALARALARLDDDEREIVRLSVWESLPPREIALVLGISANAASIRLHRVRSTLAAALGGKETAEAGHRPGEHMKEAR